MGLLLYTFEALDEAAAAYIEELWHLGDPKLWANDALASLHFYVPQARRRLPLAWAHHRTLGRHEMPAQACPIGIDLLLGIYGGLVRAGGTRSALMAVAAYHLFLRTGEMFSVRRCDLTSNAGGAVGVGALGPTKTSQRQGNESSVRVEDLAVALILRELAAKFRSGRQARPLEPVRLAQIPERRVQVVGH